MGKCTKCGKKAGFMMSMCSECIDSGQQEIQKKLEQKSDATVSSPEPQKYETEDTFVFDKRVCVWSGVAFLGVGLYLLGNPVDPAVASSNIVNLQRLTIGQTFSIVGAIFMAAGIRPQHKP